MGPDSADGIGQHTSESFSEPAQGTIVKEELKLATETLHPFSHWRDGVSRLEMLFWILVFIVGLTISVKVSTELVINYMKQPTVISVTVTGEKALEFPRITICMMYRLSKKRAYAAGIRSKRDIEYLEASYFSGYSYNHISSDYFNDNVVKSGAPERISKLIDNSNLSFIDFVRKLTPTCEDLLVTCYFGHQKKDCCFGTDRIISHNGPCLELNWVRHMEQQISGAVGGLYLRLKFDPDDVIYTEFNRYRYSALQVYTNPAAGVLERDPIMARVGEYTSIQMVATLYENLPVNRPCLERTHKTAEAFEQLVFNRYGKRKCEYQCMMEFFNKSCGCIGLSSFGSQEYFYSYCEGQKAIDCYTNWASKYDPKNCSGLMNCRSACHYWRYQVSATSVPLRATIRKTAREKASKEAAKNVSDLDDNDENVDDTTEISIFYPGIRHTIVKEYEAETWYSLISQIGGNMGLWLGASLVTVIHFIFFVFRVVYRKGFSQRGQEVNSVQTEARKPML